jgi:prepilin-type processing-associated H-X9-DG protein
LVVIAIIGILAAMVFPVFARARESARKAVCLSNVKNIALAIQMYLGDNNDTLWPTEHRQEVQDWIAAMPGGGGDQGTTVCEDGKINDYAYRANPYLRQAVLLDEYTKNRDVWRCPSAKMECGAFFIVPYADWFGYLKSTMGQWGLDGIGLCNWSSPPGWGGAVTDSVVQQRLGVSRASDAAAGGDQKAFVQSIGTSSAAWNQKLAAIDDVASFVICADAGGRDDTDSISILAYPDICCAECAGFNYSSWGWPTYDANWDRTCPNGDWCPECSSLHADIKWTKDPARRKAATRHLGGSNLGYLDGHASWMDSQRIISRFAEGEFSGGVDHWCTSGSRARYTESCGTPDPEMEFLY